MKYKTEGINILDEEGNHVLTAVQDGLHSTERAAMAAVYCDLLNVGSMTILKIAPIPANKQREIHRRMRSAETALQQIKKTVDAYQPEP